MAAGMEKERVMLWRQLVPQRNRPATVTAGRAPSVATATRKVDGGGGGGRWTLEEVGDKRMINDAQLTMKGGRWIAVGGLGMVDGRQTIGRQVGGGQEGERDDRRA